jgi:L-seryl-tRNA(Ser) seleniumtransferase
MTGRGDLPLEDVIARARPRGVPVIVDAAAQLPPAENLWRFAQMGATAAIFSGGKDLRGPQPTGLVVGEKWLIEGMRPHGSPNASLGRPMKVGKEEMAGLLAAVRRYLTLDYADRLARDERVVARWCETLGALPGVTARRSWPNEAGQPLPRAEVRIDPAIIGFGGAELVRRLWDGDPRIAVAGAGGDRIYLNPMTLTDDETLIVEAQLIELLKQRST